MSSPAQVLLVGVGGQGVLTASTMLASGGHEAGVPVIAGQLHGMSQRGGSVECSVIMGEARSSFIVGEPDLLLALEPLELLRNVHRIGPRTRVLVNEVRIVPAGVDAAHGAYPSLESILARARATGATVDSIDGPAIVATIGERRTLNVVMLGALAATGRLPLGPEQLWRAIASRCPPAYLEANRRAFEAGLRQIDASAPHPSPSPSPSAGADAPSMGVPS